MRVHRLHLSLSRAGLLATVLSILLATGVAYAATLAVGDGFLDGGGSYQGGNTYGFLMAQSQNSDNCATREAMVALKFDLTGVSAGTAVNTATLTLHVTTQNLSGNGTLTVVPVDNTSFDSSSGGTLSTANFDLASPLVTVPFSGISASSDLTLSSSQLAAHLNGKKGQQAALGLVVSSCTGSGSPPLVAFTSSSGTSGIHPTLKLFGPNAVTLASLQASGTGVEWPVMAVAGCFGLAAMGAGMLRFRRRRAVN